MIGRTAGAVLATLALAPAFAGAARAPVSLSASPAHVTLTGSSRQSIRVTSSGSTPVVVDVTRAGFALDLRGRPKIVSAGQDGSSASSWLTVRPRMLTLRPRGHGVLTVVSRLPPRAEPGDHDALLLLTTRPRLDADLAVRMRIGIVVDVRAPGPIVHQLELRDLRVRHDGPVRLLELAVANGGNVTEQLEHGRVRVSLFSGMRVIARLHAPARELLPRTSGIVELSYSGTTRGWVRARVDLARPERGATVLRRTFWIRL